MKSKKLKGTEPSVRDKLSASFLKAFQNDFEINGIEAIEKLREESPSKYAEQGLVDRALYWCAATAVAVLSDCMATTAIMPAASVTGRSICRKSKTPPLANALPPQNCGSNSVGGQTFASHCHQEPSGNTKNATNAYAIKPKHSKPRPSKHDSVKRSTFAPSPTTSPRSAVSALSAMPPNPELPLREIPSCRSASVPETRSSV